MLKIIITDKNKNVVRCSYTKKYILSREKIILADDEYSFAKYCFDIEDVSIFKFLDNNIYTLLYYLKISLIMTILYFIILLLIFKISTYFISDVNNIGQIVSQVMIVIFPLVLLLKEINNPNIFNTYRYLIIAIICYFSMSNSLLYSTSKFLIYSIIKDIVIFIFYVVVDLYRYNKSSIDVKVILDGGKQ